MFVRCPRDPTNLVLLELQGEVSSRSKIFSGLELGSLSFSNGKPTLRIGNHSLDGSVQKMKKPVVCTKIVRDIKTDDGGTRSEVQVVAIVREKYLFNTRPQPIISARPVAGQAKS